MEIATFFKCSCGHCGQIIEYLAKEAGTVVECPNCKEKSRLPEVEKLLLVENQGPPLPTTKNCAVCGAEMKFLDTLCSACEHVRKTKLRLAWGLAVVVILLISVCLYIRFSRQTGLKTEPAADPRGTMLITQPASSLPKSLNDLKPGHFSLEKKRDSNIVMAVGDIENISEHVHHDLKIELNLLDAAGTKIGAVTDYFAELGPHQIWHCARPVTNPDVKSVKLVSIKEDQ